MNQTRDNLDRLLEAAGSAEERAALTRLWNDLAQRTVEDPPASMPDRFARLLEASTAPVTVPRFPWIRIAASFAIGLTLGAMLAVQALRTDPAPPSDALRDAAVAAVLPHRSASERLASLHTLGGMATDDPSLRAELLARALRDTTPAIQLAAIDHLARLELSPAEAERLARALPEIASPIAQLTLVDLLGSRSEPTVLESLERLSRDPSVEALIRGHAEMQLDTIRKEPQA